LLSSAINAFEDFQFRLVRNEVPAALVLRPLSAAHNWGERRAVVPQTQNEEGVK
jgi:hypothetical protein